ncbi:hypothetical protein MTF65_04020 [Streptomyces sp. APSN-46.1]|uniref:hypothetical protein n=1 Tax=Streptomyces sp. APSN-46.1 TaxID=2929049 RepID=UPI001FB1A502|nr:hypothetical protein [Streptomyces sp. APSN-46.1]MCJ1676527.1 hypothetical protein [Streptomyces sp. APSN-46.1]
MARVTLEDSDIVVRLSPWETAAAHRHEVRVPVSVLREVYVEPDWWRALRGVSKTGWWIPARWCRGVRRHGDGEDFAAVKAGGPVLCIELGGSAPFRRLAVSVPDPGEFVRALLPLVPRDRV